MSAQAPPYYALKRIILMAICAIGIAIPLYRSVTMIVEIVQDDDFDIRPWDSYIIPKVILELELCSILIASCGLFGAWCRNLILTYVFAIFLLLITWLGFESARSNGIISWWVVCFFGALMAFTICFAIDLHKMKRTHKFESIPMKPVV